MTPTVPHGPTLSPTKPTRPAPRPTAYAARKARGPAGISIIPPNAFALCHSPIPVLLPTMPTCDEPNKHHKPVESQEAHTVAVLAA